MARILMHRVSWRFVTLVGCDIGLIAAAVTAGVYVAAGMDPSGLVREPHALTAALLFAAVCQLSLYYGDLYHPGTFGDRRELLVRILLALGAASLVLAAVYLLFPSVVVGNGVFVIAAVLVVPAVFAWRMLFDWISVRVRPRERLLIVGTNPAAIRLARELSDRRDLGAEVIGFIEPGPSPAGAPDPPTAGAPAATPAACPVVGTIEDIPAIVSARAVDRVVVSLADARGRLPMAKLLEMKLDAGVNFDHLASVYEEYTCKIAVEDLRPSWLIFSSGFRKSPRARALKRAMDVAAAAAAFVLFLPVMLLIAAAVKITSRGPVLYRQERVGQHGRIFTIHKFRSMHEGAESRTGAVWSRPGDERVTTIGRFLRRTRLDELPQLWNIVRGDMSLVGPRPERPPFVEELTRQIPFYGQRHVVKPGLTGWAQVRYTYGATVEDAMEKLQYDLFYIKHMSVTLDLLTVFKTVKTVVLGRNT